MSILDIQGIAKIGSIAKFNNPSEEFGNYFRTKRAVHVTPNNGDFFKMTDEEFWIWVQKNGFGCFEDESTADIM